MGFVFDPSTHSLRRIEGIPGAALVGSSVDFGFPLSSAYVAPRLDSAFVMADGVCRAHLFRLTADAPRELAVDSMGGCFTVYYSPSGTAAALYSRGSVLVIKGLPDAPLVAATVTLRRNPRPQRPLPWTLAVSDDGQYLLYGAGGLIELFGLAGDRRQVANGAREVTAAFAPGGHDAAVVQLDKLTLFHDIAGAATVRTFPGIEMPSGVAFSPDGQKLFVASMGHPSVTIIQVASGERTELPCECTATTLSQMGSLFRLNELGTEPLWLLDTASDRGLVFVPAPAGN
jgi:hypothetical protein